MTLVSFELVVKNPPANAGDIREMGSIPQLGRSSEGRNGNLLQYSCLEYHMKREAWWAIDRVLCLVAWTVACQAPLSLGIIQARILEWLAMPFSRGSSQPRD